MKLKTLAIAASLMIAPLAANAYSVNPNSNLADGGTYDVSQGPFYWDATFDEADGNGSVSFTFTNPTGFDAVVQVADGTVGQSQLGGFNGVKATWTNGEAQFIAGANTSIGGGWSISSVIGQGGSDVLTIAWNRAQGDFADIDFTIAAVPLPAGVLLLGTALVGMGAFGARRKTA